MSVYISLLLTYTYRIKLYCISYGLNMLKQTLEIII